MLTSDASAYLNSTEEVFGSEIDYAMPVNYSALQEETRYSLAECIGAVQGRLVDNPYPAYAATSCVERQNLTMRMECEQMLAA
jgi:hypothetical protein